MISIYNKICTHSERNALQETHLFKELWFSKLKSCYSSINLAYLVHIWSFCGLSLTRVPTHSVWHVVAEPELLLMWASGAVVWRVGAFFLSFLYFFLCPSFSIGSTHWFGPNSSNAYTFFPWAKSKPEPNLLMGTTNINCKEP